MGVSDKFEAGMDKAIGHVKETAGKMTDNDRMAAEGKADQVKGEAKKAAENVKDAAKDVFGDK